MYAAGYSAFCSTNTYQAARPYCEADGPGLYAHVQSTYWGLGFLKYFQWKQVMPNYSSSWFT